MMNLVIYEDYSSRWFYPLNLNRPTSGLKCGAFSLSEKIRYTFPHLKCYYILRKEISILEKRLFEFSRIKENEEYLFILSSVISEENWGLSMNESAYIQENLVGFKLSGNLARSLSENDFLQKDQLEKKLSQFNLKRREVKGRRYNYTHQLMMANSEEIIRDFKRLKENFPQADNSSVSIRGKRENVLIHKDAVIHDGVYLNSEGGPIIIDELAEVRPLSVIEGPCYIGRKVQVDQCKIGGGSSLFEGCRVGGEIGSSVMLDYSNKHHEGFLGHSYVGSFVNFGAMATNSDLKNNYGEVKLQILGETVNTVSVKMGCLIGDHSKLGIGSLLNTGTVIGVGCNLYFEGKMYPRDLPSFVWGGKFPFKEYEKEKWIKNTEKIMARRQKVLTEEEAKLYLELHDNESKRREFFFSES